MAKRPVIVLRQDKPEEQKFMISGPAQLGRGSVLDWYVKDRSKPGMFSNLEVVIQVAGGTKVSRNHAAIYAGVEFFLLDLNSMNGTRLNGEDINPTRKGHWPKVIRSGDIINFANDLEFTVESIELNSQNNYALFVAHDGGNLKGVKNDLDVLANQLERRGFQGNIIKLYNGDATKENILAQLEKVAYYTTPDSHFLFNYSGHGDKRGVALGSKGRLSPSDLYSRLSNIRGKKAVILDCCHAGVFIDKDNECDIPPGTLVLAASTKTGKAYECSTLLAGGAYMGRFTAALVKYLNSNRDSVNLKEFESLLNHYFGSDDAFRIKYQREYKQDPAIAGSSFTLLAQSTIV